MIPETVDELRALAARSDCYAAFRSTAVACGLTPGEAEQLWTTTNADAGAGDLVLDVRDAGAEPRAGGAAWLAATEVADLEDHR